MKFDLEDRLTDFAVMIINVSEMLPDKKAANHLEGQIIRSGTAPALIYGEAQAAESKKDFVHKMKLALKEIRETRVCLKVIDRKKYIKTDTIVAKALDEAIQLIAIFIKSIRTASDNDGAEGKEPQNKE